MNIYKLHIVAQSILFDFEFGDNANAGMRIKNWIKQNRIPPVRTCVRHLGSVQTS